jgi:hypothetical protein
MKKLAEIGPEALQRSFLRDEVSEAMVWLREEGYDRVDAQLLNRYLWIDTDLDEDRLDALVGSGLLRRADGGRYELTEAGAQHGSRVFADHFEDIPEKVPAPVLCACGCCGDVPETDSPPVGRAVTALG